MSEHPKGGGRTALSAGVLPVMITPSTCEAAVGASWWTVKRCAERLGIPILRLGSQTPAVEAGALLAALRAEAAARAADDASEPLPSDPVAAARASLGLRRRERVA